MSAPLSTDEVLIEKLLARLRAEGYSLRIQQWYPARVRQYCITATAMDCLSKPDTVLARAISTIAEMVRKLPPFQKWRHRYSSPVPSSPTQCSPAASLCRWVAREAGRQTCSSSGSGAV